uniref:Endonuclease/exonuclease/phosphatase domain-containing protein n=1 Tax=Trieres chinensis TaxID=1514140 RepID=A0A7S1ZMJ6_TRICV|mmetsp:Transcript_28724/g.58833  ORF Transcript_28724/g.58833 Transcript_28724/m.58833 type:complete len:205 (+) Transcript_28724:31-645(+)|eukprot:CAMPEP_0183314022 /NCGR_PEP_ID=MMETSP0160_2-20130417/47244_1 /TAXON_ID=2839 ORGANISM="Odontella Sinensis, Strain Grunow 1884" /NCGR_SAMPLE_ID=MMETSP0160_2 /ASSEMBLY_ACC=CAM_ASM_000250 /LENGTH=204 /DNA_ID=CAMNT_0025479243 /DNA_START=20 /DNA_END=634 /DNA_ORIENTATION=+
MKVIVQNLQKRPSLASEIIEQHDPDAFLAQEIDLRSERVTFGAHNTSRLGFGTAVYGKAELTDVKLVTCPHAEFGGLIRKKTTVATMKGVQIVSFHGYNGQPFKSIPNLVDHVEAVLSVLTPGPALFAGDFNTWSQPHLDAVNAVMVAAGFLLVFSWPYPGRDFPLDHSFVRDVRLVKSSCYDCASDHRGAILELNVTGQVGTG